MPVCAKGYISPQVNDLHIVGSSYSDEDHAELTEEEHLLYNEHFKPMGVKPSQFKKLIASDSCKWKNYKDSDVIVKPGEPLEKVILVHRG